MSRMFSMALSFNQFLYFDTALVTNMTRMLAHAGAFSQLLNFNTARVANMDEMFCVRSVTQGTC